MAKVETWLVRGVLACLALCLALAALLTIEDFVVDVWSVRDLDFVSADVVYRPDYYRLEITFRSQNTDFYRVAFRGAYIVLPKPVLCSDYGSYPRLQLIADPYVYGPYGRIDFPKPAPPPDFVGTRQSYYFHMPPAWPESCGLAVCTHAYDLVSKPQDVCFTLYGSRFLGLDFRSNKVVVPKAAIAAAIASAHIDWARHYDASSQIYR